MRTVLVLALVLSCQIPIVHGSSMVQRLNYGVLFQRETSVILTREYWLHTYEIKLPEVAKVPSIATCLRDNNTCLLVGHVLAQINTLRTETSSRLNKTLQTVNQLVPHASTLKRSRSKRSLLPFIGKLSKTLFGTATVEDFNVVAAHVNALTKRSRQIATALAQHAEHLSSFETKANDRMDNLMNGIKNNNVAIHYIQQQVESTAKSLQQMFEEMTSVLIQQIETSNHLNHELDQFQQAVKDLANGHLSPLLIPMQILHSTLNDIQSILSQKYPGFFVTTHSPSDLYTSSNFLFTRNNSNLYITVKIPISSERKPLQVYKVFSLPVPLNDSSKHATTILDLPDYFALTSNQQFYLTLSKYQLDTCKGSFTKQCHYNFPLTPVTKQSCSLSLFSNNKDAIHHLCNFRFVHDAISPKIIELHSNKVLLYQTPLMSMQCGVNHRMVQGCNFCVFRVPCECSLTTSNFYLPPRLTSCHNTSKEITKMHPVNLVLLQEFFDNSKFRHVFADTSFQSPLSVSLPQFKLYDHKMASVLANDKKDHLSLARMVKKAKKDEVIFQSLAEPILNGDIQIQQTWPDTNGILTVVALALSCLTTLASVYMFFKMRSLSAALMLMQQVRSIKALPTDLPAFIYKHTTESSTSNQIDFSTFISWDRVLFLLLLINSFIVLVIAYKVFKTNNQKQLLLEITNMKDCVFLTVITMPLCSSQMNIQAPQSVSSLEVSGPWYDPKLFVEWPEFSMTNALTDERISMPTCIKLGVFDAFTLRGILKTPFFVHVYINHNGYLSALSANDS